MAKIKVDGDHDSGTGADPAYGGPKPVSLRLAHHEAMLLLGALHTSLRGDVPAHQRRRVGKLIWMLEDAEAWPRAVGQHSGDAVRPATRP